MERGTGTGLAEHRDGHGLSSGTLLHPTLCFRHVLLISCSRSWTLQVSSLASKKLLPTFKKTAMIFLPCRNPAALHHCSPWRMQSSTASEGTQRLTGPALTIFPAPSPVQLELQLCRSTLGSRDPSGSQNCDSIIEKSTYAFLPSTPLKGSKRA